MMKFIPVGRVISTHGVRGEVKFKYYNEANADSLYYSSFFLDQEGQKLELKTGQIRRQGTLFLLKFKGLETAEEVDFLLKRELFVKEADLPPLDDGEYYDYQLIGLKVFTEKGEAIGEVKEVMHTKANDILVIDGLHEVLVPLTEVHIISIDQGDGIIRIREDALVE
jgi:16S rRNA processing protein RimM